MKRKEIVIQRDVTDCGPCCLLSIIIHHGGYVPLEKIRLDSYANNRGTSAYNLIKASEIYGFEAAGFKCNGLNDDITLPCIAHVVLENGFNHYVVISDIKKQTLTLMDPAKGKVIIKKEDFLKIWDNIIINFYPKQKIIKYPLQKQILSFFYHLVLEEKTRYLVIIILSLMISLLNLLFGLYFKFGVFALKKNLSIIIILLLFILISFFKNSLILFHNNKYIKLNSKVHKRLVSDFTSHIFSLPSIILHNKSSGEIMTRINELNNLKDLFSELVIGVILDGLLVISSGIVLLFLNNKMAMIVLTIMFCYFLISYISARKTNNLLHKWIVEDTNYNEILLDTIKMHTSISNLQIKRQINNNLDYHLENKIAEDLKLKSFLNKINYLKELIRDFGLIVLNTYALYCIHNNNMTMLNYIIFNTFYLYLFNSFANILNIMPEYFYLKNSIYKISEFKNLPEEEDKGIKDFSYGDIIIQNLSFSYNKEDLILNNLNLIFHKGQAYFLSGLSGSGKSTLLKILYKELDNYKGKILINNTNYKDICLKSLRDNIIYINQEENLFSGTIYQNIMCFRKIKKELFSKICKLCLIDQIVDKKPLRYFSNINDSLSNLSGGEKQQIILARNLLKNGDIIFIDEALSEVDRKTEMKIIDNLKKYYQDKILIYVSHKNYSNLFKNKVTIS